MTRSARASEDLLQEVANGDLSGIASLQYDQGRTRKAAELDLQTFQLLQIVALAAVDAPPASWYLHLQAHEETLEIEKVVGALIAIAPIVGTARVVSAAANIIAATDLVEELTEETP